MKNDDKIASMLQNILANQVILFKRLEDIENRMKGSSRSAPIESYVKELSTKAQPVIEELDKEN